MPDELSGYTTRSGRGAVTSSVWLLGATAPGGMQNTLESLCRRLDVAEVQSVGEVSVPDYCLMLAKIAHSYSAAEIGDRQFEPYLPRLILEKKLDS